MSLRDPIVGGEHGMRDAERDVVERLIRSHPALRDGTVVDPAADPPDAIIACDSGRLGFELTEIFSVGSSNSRGSEYLQFDRHWQALKARIVNVLQHQHPNLDQCDIYLRLDRQVPGNSLDLENLPPGNVHETFAVQLGRAVLARRPTFNARADRAVDVPIPGGSDFATLRQYATRIEIVWRPDSFSELNVAAGIHLPAVEAGYLHTGTEKLEAAILRKSNFSKEQRKRIAAAAIAELYLVLGGRQTGLLPHLQAETRAGLERDLAFVRYPFEHSVYDGIILFDDFNDKLEVFCTRCLSARQKERRVGVGPLDFFRPGMFDMPHACPSLA